MSLDNPATRALLTHRKRNNHLRLPGKEKGLLNRDTTEDSANLVLLFFHGYSLAHTIRPLVLGRSIRQKGFRTEFAGTGPYSSLIEEEGFLVHRCPTVPQEAIDKCVARGEYEYLDESLIDEIVSEETRILRQLAPRIAIGDFRPTLHISCRIVGCAMAAIENAYVQPGYPCTIGLPPWFSVGGSTAREYERALAGNGRQRILRLLADIPQFHPPNPAGTPQDYVYVGPLIDTRPSRWLPRRLLSRGKHRKVVISTGSTGQEPHFLEPVITSVLARGLEPVLIGTVRLRSALTALPIRIADFAPASEVLKEAGLLICTGGSGIIYHALRAGVPIIGGPEHLDQEYHLNRVHKMGLGVKLSWQQLHSAAEVDRALGVVLDSFPEFRRRCRALGKHVREWDGGELAATVVQRYIESNERNSDLSWIRMVDLEEFLEELDLSTPPSLSSEKLRCILQDGMRQGIPHWHLEKGRVCFDRHLSWNWLNQNEPRFFEPDYRANSRKRHNLFSVEKGTIRSRMPQQKYELAYTFSARLDVDTARRAVAFLPWPITVPWQQGVRLKSVWPKLMEDYLVPKGGFFFAVPVQAVVSDKGCVRLTYSCELTVLSWAGGGAASRGHNREGDTNQYLKVEKGLRDALEVATFLDALSRTRSRSERDTAHEIYDLLCSSHHFLKTTEVCQCMSCSTHQVLSQAGAHCTSMARAYVALCRLKGIPARELSGALAGYPTEPGTYVAQSRNQPLFVHTWAEIFLAEAGWVPVEFHAIALGPQALTASNVASPMIRKEVEENGRLLQEFYFGQTECARVTCSNSAKSTPQLLVADIGDSGSRRLFQPTELSYECRLEMRAIDDD